MLKPTGKKKRMNHLEIPMAMISPTPFSIIENWKLAFTR